MAASMRCWSYAHWGGASNGGTTKDELGVGECLPCRTYPTRRGKVAVFFKRKIPKILIRADIVLHAFHCVEEEVTCGCVSYLMLKNNL